MNNTLKHFENFKCSQMYEIDKNIVATDPLKFYLGRTEEDYGKQHFDNDFAM